MFLQNRASPNFHACHKHFQPKNQINKRVSKNSKQAQLEPKKIYQQRSLKPDGMNTNETVVSIWNKHNLKYP